MVPRPLFLLSDTLILVFASFTAIADLAERQQIVQHGLPPRNTG